MLNTLVEIIHNVCTAIVVYAIYVSIKNNIPGENRKCEREKLKRH